MALFFLRVIYLDQDLPPLGIGYTQPIDEGAYSLMALNLFNYGSINPGEVTSGVIVEVPVQLRTNIVGNAITYATLCVFGDNYYGMRMGSVFIAAVSLILYALVIRSLFRKTDRIAEILFLAWLLFDFMFYMNSRAVDNTGTRLLLDMIVVTVMFARGLSAKSKGFFSGALTIVSIFLVYLTNVFMVLALCIYGIVGLFGDRSHDARQFMLFLFLGFFAGLVLASVYYGVVWGSSLISVTSETIMAFSNQSGYTLTGMDFAGNNNDPLQLIKDVAHKSSAFFGANALLYNMPLTFLFIASIPPIIILGKEKLIDRRLVLTSSIVVSFLLQTLVAEDVIGRKMMCIFPVVLIHVALVWNSRDDFLNVISKLRKVGKFAFALYLSLGFLYCCYVVHYRLDIARDLCWMDIDAITRRAVLLVCLGGCFIVYATLLIRVLSPRGHLRFNRIVGSTVAIVIPLALIVFNGSLIWRFSLANPTFQDRIIMEELSEYVDEQGAYVTGGGFQLSFTLYNHMRYANASTFEGLNREMESADRVYLIDYCYEGEALRDYFDNGLFAGGKYTVKPVKVLHREFVVYGSPANMCLYERILNE